METVGLMKREKHRSRSPGLKARGLVSKDAVKRRYKALPDHEPFFGRRMQASFDRLESLQGKWVDIEIIYWRSYQLSTDIGYQPFGLRWQDLDDIHLNHSIESVKDRVRNHQQARNGNIYIDFADFYDLLVRCGQMSAPEAAKAREDDEKLYDWIRQDLAHRR